MKIFISWSKEKSRKIAVHFQDWLNLLFHTVETFYSPNDIDKGAQWNKEISVALEDSDFGLLFVTRHNTEAPWMLFEAGALSKKLDRSRVCPILFGLNKSQIGGPLGQFQLTLFTEDEVRQLVRSINKHLEQPVKEVTLQKTFDVFWNDLVAKVEAVLSEPDEEVVAPKRDTDDIIEELLERVRRMEAQVATTAQLIDVKADGQTEILERVRRMETQTAQLQAKTTVQLIDEKLDSEKNQVKNKTSEYDPLAGWDGETDLTRG